ncbi:hypothetical protein HIM_04657 [Hirsutella minnesotensis 3608]|uniref:Uncharacterized protein n=1 Tax=Hirsutella minnesotensis 3608 TaxID=1043627 RepID=A0A0F7ZV17_9HYPO|nr:hypothetical protein HIM_04657 [Hirsutella minnesotensis 3608]
MPLLLSWTTGASLDVGEALHEYVDVSAGFLETLKPRPAFGLLAERLTHDSYQHWVSEKRKDSFPKNWARLWEIHVSPADEKH